MKRGMAIVAFVAAGAAGTTAPVACTDTVDHVTPPSEGGTTGNDSGGGGGEGGVPTVNQSGQVIQLGSTSTGVPGATIALATNTSKASGDAKGKYTLGVPKDTPFSLVFSAPDYTTVREQEWKLSGDFDRKTTSLPDSQTTAQLLNGGLKNLDQTKGVLSVGLFLIGGCTDLGGATIALDPPGNSLVTYFSGGLPQGSATATVSGQDTPSAIMYNLEPGDSFKIVVTHPSCTQVPFPYTPKDTTGGAPGDSPTITYTGNVHVVAANSNPAAPTTSFIRVFLTK